MTAMRVLIVVLACSAAAVAGRQAPSEPPTFRVAVDVVSIDVAVTDRSGDVVPDLTAADIDVFQDGKTQRVTAATFVPVSSGQRAATAGTPSPAPARAANEAPPIPAPPITREQVRRTIVRGQGSSGTDATVAVL